MDRTRFLAPEFYGKLSQLAVLIAEGLYPQAEKVLAECAACRPESGAPREQAGQALDALRDMLERVRERQETLEEALEEADDSHSLCRMVENRLKSENAVLRRQLRRRFSIEKIIGYSPKMAEVLQTARRVADLTVNVLITGETGTGKELAAKMIHYSGRRRRGPFMAVNCTAVPENLFESEFFGIEKGVATGVDKRKGLFEGAHGGTLFLDEIGDMSEATQAKILRALELGEVTPVGGRDPVSVDVRLVSATNRDLERDMEAGRFRRDLYYRIKVVRLELPPLRERRDDILPLADSFLAAYAQEMGREKMTFSKRSREALREYSWPGNIRELENEMERAAALAASDTVHLEDLSQDIRLGLRPCADGPTGGGRLKRLQLDAIEAALTECGGNRTRAAQILGISRESLRRKLAERTGAGGS